MTYEERHVELVKIIEALNVLESSEEWTTLKELVFDKELTSIERQLLLASQDNPLDQAKIYALQGERKQIKKYEFKRFAESLKNELENINKQIK